MKFRFKIQQYQSNAVDSVVRVFRGQHYSDGISYVRDLGEQKPVIPAPMDQISMFADPQVSMDEIIDDTGYKNESVRLTDAELLANIHAIQTENNIHLSDGLVKGMGCCSLDIEMETGTGKTYVYIKTMFELNKRYGWSKFIVVVPSIAIREGVKKSFEITTDHFMEHYGKKARFFIYNSANLNQLDTFSADSGINVMIINTQAFAASLKEDGKSKEARIIYSKRDEFASRRPIDVIAANRPIIIMDEPQKMGGDVTQKALKSFNPLFCLNYSATHAKQHNLIYVLDALDAYNKRLVKRIEVKGFEVKNFRGTDQYLYMENIVLSPKKPPQVRLELEIAYNKSINREFRILGKGDNLYYVSNEMEQYRGFTIADIDPIAGTVTFTNGDVIRKGDVVGDVSEKDMRRVQIRETIISHFEKEEQNFNMGIKTLSLFFIDEVAKYRQYDEDGNEVLGEYGRIFEEEYYAVLAEYRKFLNPAYLAYLDGISAESTHKGYFSIDKKTGRAVDSALKRGSEFSDDISAYDLILKNKERLLSFEEPTRFIFSHSALREGWDNPNVFQICTLKHGGDSSTQKRQEVGRGLRLCVNQQGDRMDADTCGDNVQVINTLTVIASEGYSTFVKDLQDQTRSVLYERPTKATVEYFTGKTIMVSGQPVKLDQLQAKQIYKYLLKNDYISDDDSITQEYRTALAGNTLAPLPESLQPYAPEVHKLVQAIYDDSILKDMFKDGNQTKPPENPLNERFYKDAFQALWRAINHRYAYTVDFDSDELIRNAIAAIDANLYVSQLQYTVRKGVSQVERTIQLVQPMKLAERKKLRVAAYARVSCDKDAMKHSLAAQISYYNEYIQHHSDWVFAGIYADEAYSGTKDDRPRFVQLIQDCKDGKIDRIITKSISRFARNTVTLLTTVRDLRRMGIGIYFEEQNIDTLTEAGELMITLLASQAQEESRATSENCKWRIRKKFEEGYTTHFNLVGYHQVDGLVEMIPEEAELVKRIFQLYLEGYGQQAIANILREENAPTCMGGEWFSTTVRSMLRNEKYAGDLLLQKSFVADHITKEVKKNKGEMPQFFIRDDHEAIVPHEVFEAVRRENARRAAKYGTDGGTLSELSSLIRCGICRKNYRRKKARARWLWCCTTYNLRGKKYCASKSVPEETLRNACAQVLGLAEYDAEAVKNRVERIDAMPDSLLVFHLTDGTTHEVKWVFPSRSESWTDEMREKAAEQMRRRYAKTGN